RHAMRGVLERAMNARGVLGMNAGEELGGVAHQRVAGNAEILADAGADIRKDVAAVGATDATKDRARHVSGDAGRLLRRLAELAMRPFERARLPDGEESAEGNDDHKQRDGGTENLQMLMPGAQHVG